MYDIAEFLITHTQNYINKNKTITYIKSDCDVNVYSHVHSK